MRRILSPLTEHPKTVSIFHPRPLQVTCMLTLLLRLIVYRPGSEIEIQVNQVKPFIKMAAPYDPWAIQAFDLSRQYILSSPMPPIQVANANMLTNSTTRSTYRLHWNWLALWDDFGALVPHYWNKVVPQADKQRNVYTQAAYRTIVQGVATFTRVATKATSRGAFKISLYLFILLLPMASMVHHGRQINIQYCSAGNRALRQTIWLAYPTS